MDTKERPSSGSAALRSPGEAEIASFAGSAGEQADEFVLIDDAGSIEIAEPTQFDKYFVTFITFGAQLSLVMIPTPFYPCSQLLFYI
jgi:hypothetical protein